MNNQPADNPFNIDAWYQTAIGQTIAQLEQKQFALLPHAIFGQTLLQLGAPDQQHWLNPGKQYSYIVICKRQTSKAANFAVSTYTELPFPASSFDTLILPHVLELNAEPKAVLTEAWHTLAPEGHLIILGFNPWSLNHLYRKLTQSTFGLPAETKFYGSHKIQYWLRKQYYEIIYARNFCYLPFSCTLETSKKWPLFEKTAAWLLPDYGSLYLLVIKKKVLPLTPLKPRWRWRDLLSSKEITAPATGGIHRE